MSFKGKRGGGVADVIEKSSSSSFIGWNFHLHTDENGSISASEASRFFSNATRVDEEKKTCATCSQCSCIGTRKPLLLWFIETWFCIYRIWPLPKAQKTAYLGLIILCATQPFTKYFWHRNVDNPSCTLIEFVRINVNDVGKVFEFFREDIEIVSLFDFAEETPNHIVWKSPKMSHLNFLVLAFPPIFDLLKPTCLVTLFDRKL